MLRFPAGLSISRSFWVATFSSTMLLTLFLFQNCAGDIPQEYLTLASYQDLDGDGAPDIPPGQFSCKSNQLFYQGNCYDRYRACVLPNGMGQEEFTIQATTAGYGLCTLKTCSANYHNENGVCTPNVRACTPPNGTGSGQQVWNGTTYGACVATGCPANFHIEAGQCQPDTRACTVTNGTGTQLWNGSSYGVCVLQNCNSGYVKQNNQCMGPLNYLYRYKKQNFGYWLSTSPNDTAALGAGYTYERDTFKPYMSGFGITTIPLYRCPAIQTVNGVGTVAYYYVHVQCTNAPYQTTIGHLAREAGLNTANKPVFYCVPPTQAGETASRPLTTENQAECMGATAIILGYSF